MTRRARLGFAGAVAAVAVVALVGAGLLVTGVVDPFARRPTALGAPRFVDETAASGIDHVYGGDSIYETGGGVAVFDCNGDGKPDIYMAGGAKASALYENESVVGGALRFRRAASGVTDLTGVLGAYPIDIDGDGIADLVVLRLGGTDLLRGLGGCRFERANATWSFSAGATMASAFSATWEGSARLPTLAIGNYLKLDSKGEPTYDCADNAIVRPNSAGTGYATAIPLSPGYCTLSILFSSWDHSGRRDLRVTNDRHYYTDGEDQLWRIEPGQAPREYTAADGWVSMQIWGMGIASYDLTGDGYPEVFLTSQGDNKLQTLTAGPDQPTYRDVALKHRVTLTVPFTGTDRSLPSTAWHPEFDDVNNDGFVDLYVTKGNVYAQADFAQDDPSDLLLGQPGGAFREAADAAGILDLERGRGAALADFNLDGMLDLVEVNYGSPVRVWRNVGSGDAAKPAGMGNWLAVELQEDGGNRDAVGAWLDVRVGATTTDRELTIGGGHAGGQLGWTHIGLGQANQADVRVEWPDGTTGPWLHVSANQFVIVDKGASDARSWQPGS